MYTPLLQQINEDGYKGPGYEGSGYEGPGYDQEEQQVVPLFREILEWLITQDDVKHEDVMKFAAERNISNEEIIDSILLITSTVLEKLKEVDKENDRM